MTLAVVFLISLIFVADAVMLWARRNSWKRPSHPRCPRCLYDMRGSDKTCPECGYTAKTEKALWRWPKWPMLLGFVAGLTTVASVVLVWNVAVWSAEQNTLARMVNNGWASNIEYESRHPKWLRPALPYGVAKYFHRVWSIRIDDGGTSKATPGLIAFPHLRSLMLDQVTATDLAALGKMKQLRRLFLVGSNIDDTGMKTIAKLQNLSLLNITGTGVTDDGLKPLAQLPHLASLHIENTEITDAGLRHLESCKRLGYVDLNQTQTTKEGRNQLTHVMHSPRKRMGKRMGSQTEKQKTEWGQKQNGKQNGVRP